MLFGVDQLLLPRRMAAVVLDALAPGAGGHTPTPVPKAGHPRLSLGESSLHILPLPVGEWLKT